MGDLKHKDIKEKYSWYGYQFLKLVNAHIPYSNLSLLKSYFLTHNSNSP